MNRQVTTAGAPVASTPKLAMELSANYDFFRDQPIVPRSLEGLPPTEQYDERTSQTARQLSQSNIPGFADRPPIGIDYLLRGFSPGPAEAMIGLADLVLARPGAPSEFAQAQAQAPVVGPLTQLPVIGGIVRPLARATGEEQRSQAYERASELAASYRRQLLAQVQASPAYQRATPDLRRQMLRGFETDIRERTRELTGALPTERDLGLPPKYPGVRDLTRQRAIDEAIATYRAWQGDPTANIRPTAAQLKLALAYENLINPAYTEARRRQAREAALIEKRVKETVTTPAR